MEYIFLKERKMEKRFFYSVEKQFQFVHNKCRLEVSETEKEFVLLSERQMDWMKKAIGQMLKLTVYYAGMEQPLKEEDYERITDIFSDYTKKSRNNRFVIMSAMVFEEYLDGLGKKEGFHAGPDMPGMRKMEQLLGELFELAAGNQNEICNEAQLQRLLIEMKECSKKADISILMPELTEVFQAYLSFCMDENAKRKQEQELHLNRKKVRAG